MRKPHFSWIWAGLITALAVTLQAQTPARGDSVVQITADAQGLSLVSPDQLPPIGTYWMITPGGGANGCVQAPLPIPPSGGLPIYQVADGEFIVDGTVGETVSETVMEAQANAIVNLINQIQGSQMQGMGMRAMDDSGPLFPGSDGGSGGSGDYPTNSYVFSINTNLLWLQITNVFDATVYANIYNATDYVYAVLNTTNLLTPWQVVGEVFPTDTNCMPFTLPTLNQNTLFLRAEDWTGMTENGNQTPDWWFWYYYGTTALSDTNLDSQGNQLVDDYWDETDPNIISFSIAVTNNYVNSVNAPLQINVTAGVPFYIATLVNSTNFASANWSTYASSNITVNLGSTQGWQDVWVGLRGFPTDATQTWQWQHLNLTVPPVLAITNPTTSTVDEPTIQIYGFSQEPLASISYGVSNALGTLASLPSEITDQYYDTNLGNFTTNYFECLDVPLTNGLNVITIQATDLAGDTSATNFSFTVDYSSKTNPPSFQITWPQNGTQVSGSNFTCQGVLADPTATVMTQVVFTNEPTNIFVGGVYTNHYVASVDRNGDFWLENLPMSEGTNVFVITVSDVAGNIATTNIIVVQSSLSITINPVTPDSQLWQTTVYLSGTISDPTYAVWVNGVKGYNNGDGTWYANNVPVNDGGTASFKATAYSSAEQQPDGSFGN